MEKHYLKLLMAIVMLLIATTEGFSQENQNPTKATFNKHEFNLSVGAFPLVGIINFALAIYPHPVLGYYVRHGGSYGLKVGALNLEYIYNFSSKFSTGYTFSYSMFKTREAWLTRYCHLFSNQTFLKYKYFENNKICFYSSIYFGFTYGVLIDYPGVVYTHRVTPNMHVCLFGTTIKEKLLIEVGSGNQGILKIGYKF